MLLACSEKISSSTMIQGLTLAVVNQKRKAATATRAAPRASHRTPRWPNLSRSRGHPSHRVGVLGATVHEECHYTDRARAGEQPEPIGVRILGLAKCASRR